VSTTAAKSFSPPWCAQASCPCVCSRYITAPTSSGVGPPSSLFPPLPTKRDGTGPETVDRALIGTTRRVNARTGMIEFSRLPSNGHSNAPGTPAESVIYRLDPVRESQTRRLIFQLGTSDPARAVAAARIVAPDVAGIDVNAGCPKPFSTSGGMGAALLRTPDLLVEILEALVKEVVPEFGIAVSVKIRLLETAEETEALVRRLVRTGIAGLTVHCRTTPMRPRERAIRGQLRLVGDVCREAGVACVMNGDVDGREQAEDLIKEFGVDGAMIATAAEKNPSCFRPGKLAGWEEVARQYVQFAIEAENKFGNTKFSLQQLIPGREPMCKRIIAAKTYTELVEVLGLDDMRDAAAEVDRALGMEAAKKHKQERKQAETDKKAQKKRRRDSNDSVQVKRRVLDERPAGLSMAAASAL